MAEADVVRGAVRRAASDEEDECEKAFEMAEDGGMGGTDGGAEPLRVEPGAKMDAAGEWQMTKCNEGDPIRGGGNEGPETGGGSRTGAGESAHQAAPGGAPTTWVHATHDPTLSNLPKYPFTVQSTSWTLQPLGRVSKHFIMQHRS